MCRESSCKSKQIHPPSTADSLARRPRDYTKMVIWLRKQYKNRANWQTFERLWWCYSWIVSWIRRLGSSVKISKILAKVPAIRLRWIKWRSKCEKIILWWSWSDQKSSYQDHEWVHVWHNSFGRRLCQKTILFHEQTYHCQPKARRIRKNYWVVVGQFGERKRLQLENFCRWEGITTLPKGVLQLWTIKTRVIKRSNGSATTLRLCC